MAWLFENISSESIPSTEYMIKNCIYSNQCSCIKRQDPLRVKLEEHWNIVSRGEIEKSGMADNKWKEKENHLPLWDEVKIIDREEYWS